MPYPDVTVILDFDVANFKFGEMAIYNARQSLYMQLELSDL